MKPGCSGAGFVGKGIVLDTAVGFDTSGTEAGLGVAEGLCGSAQAASRFALAARLKSLRNSLFEIGLLFSFMLIYV